MKRLVIELDDKTHAAFKAKTATEFLSMTEVATWLITDYNAGRVKARPRDRQQKEVKKST